jgi:hypothetical protein
MPGRCIESAQRTDHAQARSRGRLAGALMIVCKPGVELGTGFVTRTYPVMLTLLP